MNRQPDQNLISPQAADLLISRGDGDMALLYLYLCRTNCLDREKAGRDLFMPSHRLSEAYERLELCGLLPLPNIGDDTGSGKPSVQAPDVSQNPAARSANSQHAAAEMPEYTAEEVRSFAEQDEAFAALAAEARLIIGRHLSTQDLIRLLGIYTHFSLPAEVLMELMHFVAESYREKYGESRRPTVHAFEREARLWSERGIADFDAAEQYIRNARERSGLMARIREAMGIANRDFTNTERQYVDVWLDCGFGPEAIALACDRTLTKTHNFSPAYMNGILMKWHEKGLHSLEEIEARDGKSASGRAARAEGRTSTAANPEDIWKIVEQI